MIINSQDTSEWPSIAGERDKPSTTLSSTSGAPSSTRTTSTNGVITTEPALTSASGGAADMAAATQSSQSQPQTDQSSSAAAQQPWLDGSSLGWDKKNTNIHAQSNPSTPRLDTGAHFSGWGASPFNSEGSSSSTSYMQSTWGSQSPSLGKQPSAAAATSDWGVNAGTANQWGAPSSSTSSNLGIGESSWGQPKRLPNTGADSWGQTSQADSSSNQSNPSTLAAQQPPTPSQWNQPPPAASPVWQSGSSTSSDQTTSSMAPTSTVSSSTGSMKQWGATPVAGQSSASPTSSVANAPSNSAQPPTTTPTSTPTSWAGAAAKGLPKAPPKQPEPVDPIQLQIEQSINNPDGWGKVPVRQDTSWGKPPEKKKQDDSNQWQATPNNGTAIWEASKSSNGHVDNDKSTWNQKVAGNNDPNVWNGEGSKGKDNALWDDVSTPKDPETNDQGNTWNAPNAAATRTVSQSSGDNNSDGGWSASNMTRTSPPNIISNQPPPGGHDPSGWPNSANGPMDMGRGKANRWDGNLGGHRGNHPDSNGLSYWEGGSQKPGPSGWSSSKQQGSWNGDNGHAGGGNWGQNQPMVGGANWGDGGMPGSHWQNPGGRKPSAAWDDNPAMEFRDRKNYRSESDIQRDDADMGDWNESNSVWSSANGFKQSRRPGPLPHESNMPLHNSIQRMPPGAIGPGPGMNGTHNLTKHQMLNMLIQMGYPREEAHAALIRQDLDLNATINDLKKTSPLVSGPMGDYKFNPNMPPPMPMNTPYGSNAQINQSVQQSSHQKSNQVRNAVGPMRGSALQQQNQKLIATQLQVGVAMGNIHPHILNLPGTERNLRSIQQLVSLQLNYQQSCESLMRKNASSGNPPMDPNLNPMLANIKKQMTHIQQSLLGNNNQVLKPPVSDMRALDIAPLGLNPSAAAASTMGNQSGSRLGIWTDKAPGGKQGASASLHSSHSTPNLQGGLTAESNPWTTAGSVGSTGWSGVSSPASQYLDNHNESHPSASSSQSPNQRPINQSASATPTTQSTFDIPEFIPGQPWAGVSLTSIEDDPTITPGSVSRSMSVTVSGLNSPDWVSGSNKSTWSNATSLSAIGGADTWSKSGTRPPPGFNKNVNRSVSMPQGPSEKTSAFSPVGSSWDSKHAAVGGGNTWLVLRNLTPQIDGATLKTLCSQHGPLLNFFVNQSNGQALVQYANKAEGMKAHRSLNSCVLGNTTIMTEFVDESEAQRILDQRPGSLGRSSSMSAAPGSAMWPNSMWGTNPAPSSSTWGNNLLDQHNMSTPDFLSTGDYAM